MPIVKLILILFIAAQVVFFATLLRPDALLFPAGIPLPEPTGGHSPNWPPKVDRAGTSFDTWGLPLVNTLILLTSGITFTWAQHALMQGNRRGLKWGLIITIVLGILFVLCQAYEYMHAASIMWAASTPPSSSWPRGTTAR
jgi:cytochrome c oxidase subunit 3